MKPRAFSPPQSGDLLIQELAQRILEFARMVSDCDLIIGRLIKRQTIVSGTVKVIEHGLQRIPEGWFLTRKSAAADVYEASDPTAKKLSLNASSNVTVDLWVF